MDQELVPYIMYVHYNGSKDCPKMQWMLKYDCTFAIMPIQSGASSTVISGPFSSQTHEEEWIKAKFGGREKEETLDKCQQCICWILFSYACLVMVLFFIFVLFSETKGINIKHKNTISKSISHQSCWSYHQSVCLVREKEKKKWKIAVRKLKLNNVFIQEMGNYIHTICYILNLKPDSQWYLSEWKIL